MAPVSQPIQTDIRARPSQASNRRTRDPRSRTAHPSGFLWVNKDASSGSLSCSSDATEKVTINRHVQRGRKHRLELMPAEIPRFGFAFRRRSAADRSGQGDVAVLGKCSSPELESEQTLDHPRPSASGEMASGRDVSDAKVFSQWPLARYQQERLVRIICQPGTPVDPF